MTKEDVQKLRAKLGLSPSHFGQAIGFAKKSAVRAVTRFESGELVPTGSALAAMRYLEAICDVFGKDYVHPHHEIEQRLRQALPLFMRDRF